MRIGTTSSAEFVLQRGSGDGSIHNWGWTDNGWSSSGVPVYFASTGTHTVRVQQREDGAMIDQIVLSPQTYFTSPPGPSDDDTTILAASAGGSTGGGGALPSPWTHGDVGATTRAGTASYSSGVFTVSGTGADIWGSSDAFHFVYHTLAGDGTIQARVLNVQQAATWSKAGVMIRESLAANAKHAFMLVSAAKGMALQWRPTTGGTSLSTAVTMSAAPRWVRLVRSGSTLTGYQSSDGSTWTQVGSASLSMASTVYVGLAVTSHSTASSTATFDSVTVY
jgi:regulation of enolase protein 1 (concanavalin A-like superfamily)